MKNYKKILSGALAIALVVSSASCSGGGRGEGDTTTQAPSITTTNLNDLDIETDYNDMANIGTVDEANEVGAGKLYESGKVAGTVSALCYYDLATAELDVTELFATRFGGTIETTMVAAGSGYFETLGKLVASGDSPDIVRYDWQAYPDGVTRGRYTALDDWLDIESPLWSDLTDVINSFTYGGKHYYFPSNVSPSFAIIYNATLFEENGLENPMDLYEAGNWNWNTFEDMLVQWANKGDEYVGFTGGSWSSMQFANTTGIKTIDFDGKTITNNLRSNEVRRTMDWLENMQKNGLIGTGFTDPGEAFVDGTLLFLGMGLTWGYESAQQSFFTNQIDGEIQAVPFPRDPNADKYYIAGDTYGFMVPAGAENVQGAVAWILCNRLNETDPDVIAERYAEETDPTPVYYPKCPSCKYNFVENDNDELTSCPECSAERKQKFKAYYSERQMAVINDMKDPEKFSLVFDNCLGFNDDFATIFTGSPDTSVFDAPLYGGASYTTLIEENINVIETTLDTYRDLIEANS